MIANNVQICQTQTILNENQKAIEALIQLIQL